MAAKDRARGKSLERWVAARLGYRRRRSGETFNGRDDNVLPDGSLAPVSIECKADTVLKLRVKWLEQAARNAGERPWIVVQRPLWRRNPVATMDWFFAEALLNTAGYTNRQEAVDVELSDTSGTDPQSDKSVVRR